MRRASPFAPLCEDWEKLYTFFQTVAAAGTESAESEVIYGTFRLDWVMAFTTTANVPNNQLTVGVKYDDSASAINFDVDGKIGAQPTGDNGANPANMIPTAAPVIIPVGVIVRHGATRLFYAYRNATGAQVSIFGNIHITHLREKTADDYGRWY